MQIRLFDAIVSGVEVAVLESYHVRGEFSASVICQNDCSIETDEGFFPVRETPNGFVPTHKYLCGGPGHREPGEGLHRDVLRTLATFKLEHRRWIDGIRARVEAVRHAAAKKAAYLARHDDLAPDYEI